ncbi:MAG: cobalamin-binding protein, partial [Chloroflexi bacterium]|nr:cobalamin-binding protein [Chloroflexota bacterium]
MRYTYRRLIFLFVLLAALAACGPSATPTTAPIAAPTATTAPVATPIPAPTIAPTPTAPAPTATPSAFPLTVSDAAERKVTLAKAPQKSVSLAPSNTGIVFAIGLGGKLVAIDDFSDFPAEAKGLPHIGGFKLNFEQIVALTPDLVL